MSPASQPAPRANIAMASTSSVACRRNGVVRTGIAKSCGADFANMQNLLVTGPGRTAATEISLSPFPVTFRVSFSRADHVHDTAPENELGSAIDSAVGTKADRPHSWVTAWRNAPEIRRS